MRVKAIVLFLICSIIFCGCSGKSSEQTPASPKEVGSSGVSALLEGSKESEKISDSSEDSVKTTEENTEKLSEESSAVSSDISLYESFLNNEAKVHIIPANDHGTYFGFGGDKEKDYTLEELVNAIIADYIDSDENVKIWLDSIKYAYIDCGNDGKKELALWIYTPQSAEYWQKYFIIKDIDGTLKSVYSNIAWSRSSIYLNEYGYIFGDGSGGAAYHSFDKSYVDADGKWHFIYDDMSTAGIVPGNYGGDLYFNGASHMVPEDTPLDGEYAFLQFNFGSSIYDDKNPVYTYAKQVEGTVYDYSDGYRSYFYMDLVNDDSLYDDSHPLKQFFDNEGLHIYTLNEINQMIADKEAKEGLTEDIKNGENVVWETLDYNFEPYISTYNDDNFLNMKAYFPLHFILCSDDGGSTSLNIESDGSINGSFTSYTHSDTDNSSVVDKNDFTGTFTIGAKQTDTIYFLSLSNYSVANMVGTSETNEYVKGYITTTNYVDVPGLNDRCKRFCLYCPGTKKSEIDAQALKNLPDFYHEQDFEEDELKAYILYGMDGDHYVWRTSW